MDNLAIARILRETADLLEIKNENPFKIRAYRNGADIAANHPHQLAALDEAELRQIPGIGKDLSARIREIAQTGGSAFHQELVAEFPPSVLDLLHLQGLGPKTVATLYRELNIRTIEDLQNAAAAGRVRALRGMGAKKEALILKALEERARHSGRHLLPQAHAAAEPLIAFLQERAPAAIIDVVGSLRRGTETCGDLDVLASGAQPSLMDDFVSYRSVERILGRGETKSSVLLWGGFQADLRIVAAESRGAAMQYFTGSKAHNVTLRDRAIRRGFKLNEYGLFRTGDETRVASTNEDEIYLALGLDWIPPELREDSGEFQAAEAHALPRLVDVPDLRGDLHAHTVASDGKDSIRAMADAARAAGLHYLAITEHSKSLMMANGLDESQALAHAKAIHAVGRELNDFHLLAGIECDIRPDGTLDLSDDCLASLDIVVASVHSAFNQDRSQMTDRILRALENPYVDVLGHPTGRRLLKRDPYPLDVEAVLAAAARTGAAIEINSQVERLDLNEHHARRARDLGVPIVISSDAHSQKGLGATRWGVSIARRAWLEPRHVLNTLGFDAFRGALRRRRAR